jgi:hypothetical protein
MEPAPGAGKSPPPKPPWDRKRWAMVAFMIVIAAVVAAVSLPGLVVEPPGGTSGPISATVPGTTIIPPHHRTPVPAAPKSPGATPTETAEATLSPTPSETLSGPPGFTVSIFPVQATAKKGDTVVYHMTIEAQNGFTGEIHMMVTAGFLFFSDTKDLGVQEPPYPKTIDYAFTVPGTLPPGVTVNGVVTSTSEGITREDHLSLTVQ